MRLFWDENTSHHILRALQRARPDLDIATVQHLGLSGADDTAVIERAVAEGRVLVTHDRATIPAELRHRQLAGLSVPGVIIIRTERSVREIVEDFVFVLSAATSDDLRYPIFIPFP